MPLYRKKPVTIEAVQYDGTNYGIIKVFAGDACERTNAGIYIHTLEGDMKVSRGDYVIKGVHGEFYPCKPDIFLETYEQVKAMDRAQLYERQMNLAKKEYEENYSSGSYCHEQSFLWGYEEGYRQAEQDLARARNDCNEHMPKEIYITSDFGENFGYFCKYGNPPYVHRYIRSDLTELTWKDIETILYLKTILDVDDGIPDFELYKEILRRFNELKAK